MSGMFHQDKCGEQVLLVDLRRSILRGPTRHHVKTRLPEDERVLITIMKMYLPSLRNLHQHRLSQAWYRVIQTTLVVTYDYNRLLQVVLWMVTIHTKMLHLDPEAQQNPNDQISPRFLKEA